MTIPTRILLDTNVVIQLLKKQADWVVQFVGLHEQGVVFYLSPIVIAEIYVGAFKKEHAAIEAFFSLCTLLTLDAKTAKKAGLLAAIYRQSHQGISLEDYLLAATAIQLDCSLWTQNKKHYPMTNLVLFEG
ncbi:MAG: type II toxin-antitoxin system VapC family toxin [Gallionella sp.]|nr:type II toxin-antitoxin system VapC family toxin [Gallionella sp.]